MITTPDLSKITPKFDATKVPSMEGKIVVITGANSGVGYINALEIARNGGKVILACRNEEKGNLAAKQINEAIASFSNKGEAVFMKLDVSSLKSVDDFSKELHQKVDRVNVLINNAGIMAPPFSLSMDGFESQFATNHLGHFTLTGLIFDLMKKGAPSRIVNVSSIAHRRANFNFDDLPPKQENYSSIGVYAMTKASNILFTNELERRLRENDVKGVIAVAAHPGVSKTNLTQSTVNGRYWFLSWIAKLYSLTPLHQSAEMGALPILYAATVGNVAGGEYYGPAGFQNMWGYPTLETPTETVRSPEIAKTLWELSEKLTNTIFNF